MGEECRNQRYPLAGTLSRFAIDEKGDAVTWSGATIETGGQTFRNVDVTDITVKFPFNTQARSYRIWNPDLRRAVPLSYVGTERIDGLKVLRFRGVVEPVDLGGVDIPGSVIGRAEPSVRIQRVTSSTTDYLVEPETGAVISAAAEIDNYATLEGQRVLTLTRGTFVTPKADASSTADTYRPLALGLVALRLWVPWTAIPSGLVAIAIAVWLSSRSRGKKSDRESQAVAARDSVSAGL